MRNKGYHFLIGFFSVLFISATPDYKLIQQVAADLKKVHTYYSANPNLSMDTYYLAFEEHNSTAPKEASYGSMVRTPTSYYTKMLRVETLNTKNMIIVVDNEEKSVVVGDQGKWVNEPMIIPVDSLLLICSDIEVLNNGPNERKYSLFFDDADFSEYDQIDFCIDTKNNRFTKLILYYNAAMNITGNYYGEDRQPRLEVQFKNYRTTIQNTGLLDQKNYVIESKGELTLAGRLKGYTLLDQRKKARLK